MRMMFLSLIVSTVFLCGCPNQDETPTPTKPSQSAVVPEPDTILLMGTGLVTVAGLVRRRFLKGAK